MTLIEVLKFGQGVLRQPVNERCQCGVGVVIRASINSQQFQLRTIDVQSLLNSWLTKHGSVE
jgi:hypothetical protein